MQVAAATALRATEDYFKTYTAEYRERRDLLVDGLLSVGFNVKPPEGTYFILADHTPFGFEDDVAFCHHLVKTCGVVGIPPTAFIRRVQKAVV